MNLKKLVPIVALACAAGSAAADDFVVNAGTLPVLPDTPFAHVFTHQPGSFFDTVNFNIAAGTLISAASPLNLSLDGLDIYHISSLSYAVVNGIHGEGTTTYANYDGDGVARTLTLTAPGAYHIDITGIADGVAGGVYAVSLVTAVPEPETYAMLLVGLAGLAGVARRRDGR